MSLEPRPDAGLVLLTPREKRASLAERFGLRLAGLRQRRDLSQAELAEKAGLTLRAVQYLERGERMAKLDTLLALATALSVDPNKLLLDLGWR